MWSPKQRKLVLVAAKKAGWCDCRRYLAMRACGCPLNNQGSPSVTHPENRSDHLAAVMALAESCAAQRGHLDDFPRPGRSDSRGTTPHRSWNEAAQDRGQRLRDKARAMWAEAIERMPGRFVGGPEGLEAFARRVTEHDAIYFSEQWYAAMPAPGSEQPVLDHLDAGQLIRVVEGLRAWLGREFFKAGLTPRTFHTPRGAIEQVKAEVRRRMGRVHRGDAEIAERTELACGEASR